MENTFINMLFDALEERNFNPGGQSVQEAYEKLEKRLKAFDDNTLYDDYIFPYCCELEYKAFAAGFACAVAIRDEITRMGNIYDNYDKVENN